ncbi:MAG: hypothetical protein GX817_04110 [Elusimicrobia bacterium]|nr:hypothetical protein [Elusimicrobiota bacterium]
MSNIPLVIIVPLVAAILIPFCKYIKNEKIKPYASSIVFISVLLFVFISAIYLLGSAREWFPFGHFPPLGLVFRIDGLSGPILLFTSATSLLIAVFSLK